MSRTAPLWLLLAALGGGLCGCEDDSTGHAARDGGRALADGRVREQPDTLTFLDQGPQRPPDAELLPTSPPVVYPARAPPGQLDWVA